MYWTWGKDDKKAPAENALFPAQFNTTEEWSSPLSAECSAAHPHGRYPMEITARSLWTLIHGMGFGSLLYLLACSGVLIELYRRYSREIQNVQFLHAMKSF